MALPVYFCVAIVLSYVAYFGLIFLQTAPLSDMSTITGMSLSSQNLQVKLCLLPTLWKAWPITFILIPCYIFQSFSVIFSK